MDCQCRSPDGWGWLGPGTKHTQNHKSCMCVCVHVVCVEFWQYVFVKTCKRLGPVRVRRTKYSLLLLLYYNTLWCPYLLNQLFLKKQFAVKHVWCVGSETATFPPGHLVIFTVRTIRTQFLQLFIDTIYAAVCCFWLVFLLLTVSVLALCFTLLWPAQVLDDPVCFTGCSDSVAK